MAKFDLKGMLSERSAQEIDLPEQKTVVPHAGTWIEIDREPASA